MCFLCQAVKQILRQWTKPDNHALIPKAALDLTRSKSELVLENALLRQQLIMPVALADGRMALELITAQADPVVDGHRGQPDRHRG